MGLNTTHGAWDGAYSGFHRWRENIAKYAEFPPLQFMEGYYSNDDHNVLWNPFYAIYAIMRLEIGETNGNKLKERLDALKEGFPIKWESLKPSALHELMLHSDCEGDIKWENCKGIADALIEVLKNVPDDVDLGGHIGNFKKKTQTFIDGLMTAYDAKENLEFH